MFIDAQFNRRLRIVGLSGNVHGAGLSVYDEEKDEPVFNVKRVELVLDAGEINVARLTFYERDQHGSVVTSADGEPVTSTVTVKEITVTLSAYEIVL